MVRISSRALRVVTVAAAAVAVLAARASAQVVAAPAVAGAVVAGSTRSEPFRPRRRGRIVGGRAVTRLDPDSGNEWMAALFTPWNGFYCSSSLIGPNHVLTSAACYPRVGDKVRLGSAVLFQGLVATVTKVTVHPNFQAFGNLNDLAVLTLDSPGEAALLRAGAIPISLDTVGEDVHGHYIHGFGAVDKAARTAGSLQLKRGYQPRVPWATCRAVTGAIFVDGVRLPVDESKQVCTNYLSFGSGALCQRDPGGAMYRVDVGTVNGARVKIPKQYAVASYWIALQTEKCPQGMPNVGTLVAPYAGWIQGAMA